MTRMQPNPNQPEHMDLEMPTTTSSADSAVQLDQSEGLELAMAETTSSSESSHSEFIQPAAASSALEQQFGSKRQQCNSTSHALQKSSRITPTPLEKSNNEKVVVVLEKLKQLLRSHTASIESIQVTDLLNFSFYVTLM